MAGFSNILVFCILLATVVATRAQAPQILVGPNVQVSAANKDQAHTEVWVAANPRDANHLIGCSIVVSQSPYKAYTIAYLSFDGGRSWSPTLETKEFFMATDPGCTIGFDGTAYFLADLRTSPERTLTKVYRSKDGGRTWLPPVGITFVERPSIIVDGTNSEYRGHVYINGWGSVRDIDGNSRATGLTLSRSLNAGENFESPLIRAPLANSRHYVNTMGNCVVMSSGNIVCAFGQSNDESPLKQQVQSLRLWSKLKVMSSADGGRSFSNADTVAEYYMRRRPPGTTSIVPTLAINPADGPFRDRLYVGWSDVASGRSQIGFSYSSDGGKTWSRPKTVNDDEPFDLDDPSKGPDDFMPVVAVNRDGVVGVMWYDRRHDPNNIGWHVRFRASLDGGETFLPSVQVSEAPAAFEPDEKWPIFYWQTVSGGGSPSGPGGFLKFNLQVMGQLYNGGDYAGMAAGADGRFHPFWVDNRTGVHQIWTAPVNVKGVVVSQDSTTTESLDVTAKVTAEITSVHFDRATEELVLDVRLKNVSGDRIAAPIKGKLIKIESPVARKIEVITTDSNKPDVVWWNFADGVKQKDLLPGETTDIKRLIFKLQNIRPFRQGRDVNFGMLNFEMQVLSALPKI